MKLYGLIGFPVKYSYSAIMHNAAFKELGIDARYELFEIVRNAESPWAMCYEEDIGACVHRISDGKKFLLGLSELKATDQKSKNYQLLDD